MRTRLFKSGGSWAVRIPMEWVPEHKEVDITFENGQLYIAFPDNRLRALAERFAADGLLSFDRPEQPPTPPARPL